MSDLATDQEYLRYQYGDAEKLRIRQQSHALYSEQAQSFLDWLLPFIDPQPGFVILDVGCGSGIYHPLLAPHGVRIIALDASRGMLQAVSQQAQQQRLSVETILASAEALPLASASCERVMGNHMLYHVVDQIAALREMRRMLKPGGKVILATNAADSGRRLLDLHLEAARKIGYTPLDQRITTRFSLDHLDLVQTIFPSAQRFIYEDAFLFPTVEAALTYYASGIVDLIAELPEDGSHRAKLLPLVAARIGAVIQREGLFRVPKNNGCFVAEV